MQLVQLAALFVMLMYVLLTETSGARTCWFHKKTRTSEECRGKVRRFNAAMARYLGGTTEDHALDTGPELIEKRIGFVHVHFLCTLMASIPALYRKGSSKCLTASGV